MKWLDALPWSLLSIAALLFLLLPIYPEPHLFAKARMLTAGTLTRPLDIFDIFYHCLPSIMIIIKMLRQKRTK